MNDHQSKKPMRPFYQNRNKKDQPSINLENIDLSLSSLGNNDISRNNYEISLFDKSHSIILEAK